MEIKFQCEVCGEELSIDVDEEVLKRRPITRISLLHGNKPHTIILYLNRNGEILNKEYVNSSYSPKDKALGVYSSKSDSLVIENLKNIVYNKLSPIIALLITGHRVALKGLNHKKDKVLELIDFFVPYPLNIVDNGEKVYVEMDLRFEKKSTVEYDWRSGRSPNLKLKFNHFRESLIKYRKVGDLRVFLSKISRAYLEIKKSNKTSFLHKRTIYNKVLKEFNIQRDEGKALKELLKI
ncbi:MAG: hypothetical protein ACP6IP_04175 [Candidatus Njordarchaeia archaeon]